MLNDLKGKGACSGEAGFVVIGAGTVGLVTSVMLARRTGQKVICLETGGGTQNEDHHPQNAVVQLATPYKGASDGRFRCLGGTSTRWGGALIPFQDADIVDANWPIGPEELAPYIAEVEALFGLEPGPYSDTAFPEDLGADYVNRLAKWPEFKKRNVARLFDEAVQSDPDVEIWLNAHVSRIDANETGVSLVAISPDGQDDDRLHVHAGKLIIAAGAIETTRLALLIAQARGGEGMSPTLGRYFTDHISTEVAEIVSADSSKLNRIVGFRFGRKGAMRNIRFELAPGSHARKELPPSFSHIGFSVDTPGGFDVLRGIFQHLQRRKLPPARVAIDLVRHAPWLARAVWWRLAHKRLLFPSDARLIVHAVLEQVPIRENAITLSTDQVDQFGLPLAAINWGISARDKLNIVKTAELFRETWEASGLAKYGAWKPIDLNDISNALDDSGGIFHPTGSTRMGRTLEEGTVDPDLNLFGVPHVQLLATSILPTGGGANPTMTLMMFAMRCVDQHCKAAGQ